MATSRFAASLKHTPRANLPSCNKVDKQQGGENLGVYSVAQEEEQIEEDNDVYYAFCTTEDKGPSTMELSIADKLVNVIVDSGASCNLMSSSTFELLTGGGSTQLKPCNKRIYAYASKQALDIQGSCQFNVCVPETNVCLFLCSAWRCTNPIGAKILRITGHPRSWGPCF